MNRIIGQPVRRREDDRLVIGQGDYSDDLSLPGQAHAYLLRSPHAHALIKNIDTAAAAAMPGVLGVYTAADYEGDGMNPLPAIVSAGDILDPKNPAIENKDGSPIYMTPIDPLASGRVRHIGYQVAMVVAETLEQAKDAAELIEVDYDLLPAYLDARDAIAEDAVRIWDDIERNIHLDLDYGDAGAVDAAFAKADHVVEMDLYNQRVAPISMEPRAGIGAYDAENDIITLHAGGQGAVLYKKMLMRCFDIPPEKVRVITKDVGGGFGMRNPLYPENLLSVWAARKLNRPVRWTADRSEGFLSDYQGRDYRTKAALALDKEGKFLAIRVDHYYTPGAYGVGYAPVSNGIRIVPMSYDIPLCHFMLKSVFTNTQPTAPYRGAGRPEANFNLERMIETAAREMNIDRFDIRYRNLIPNDAFPYMSSTGLPYDCGEFHKNMDMISELADWPGFESRKADTEARGLKRGIGIANYLETPTGQPQEWTQVTVQPDSEEIEIWIGTGPSGQGHETVFPQVIAEMLGVPFEQVHLKLGDTDVLKEGGGSHSNRSMRLGGTILVEASEKIIEQGKKIASHLLEAAVADIDYTDGEFIISGTDRTMDIFSIARAAETDASLPEELRGQLAAETEIRRRLPAYPNGCAACEVEVDPDTGAVEIVRYSSVDDVGRVINPMIVHGQVHGGIAQGVGQALMEDMKFDKETGQMLTGTFMDYCLPRADDFPSFATADNPVPAPSNPLGVKGGGEGGTVPALAIVINAIIDALYEFGVRDIPMPATPHTVWRAIQQARSV